jgi:hypothetical protein
MVEMKNLTFRQEEAPETLPLTIGPSVVRNIWSNTKSGYLEGVEGYMRRTRNPRYLSLFYATVPRSKVSGPRSCRSLIKLSELGFHKIKKSCVNLREAIVKDRLGHPKGARHPGCAPISPNDPGEVTSKFRSLVPQAQWRTDNMHPSEERALNLPHHPYIRETEGRATHTNFITSTGCHNRQGKN